MELNPSGPVQLYATPAVAELAEKYNVSPWHIGVLTLAVIFAGVESTSTAIIVVGEGQPYCVANTEYTPVAVVGAPVIVGSCSSEVNPSGPLHV